MQIKLEVAGNQIDGARDYQEDAFMITRLGDGAESNAVTLVIMADGMGGHAAGNVASNMVTSTFNKSFSGQYPSTDMPAALKSSLLKANDAISQAVRETPGLKGMGCTMVAAFVEGDKLWWVSVGDSHLYLLRDRELIKLNADHSYGGYLQRMREQGMAVDSDPNLSPNMLMSAMIGEEISDIDLSEQAMELRPGDRVMIASDGLDTLGQGAVIQYSAWSDNPRDCVAALLEAVESANQPKQDNTTIVCVDIQETHARAVPPEEGEEDPSIPVLEPLEESDIHLEAAALQAHAPEPEFAAIDAAAGDETDDEGAGARRGVLLTILGVLVLIGAAAAGYWYWSQSTTDAPPPVAMSEEPAADPDETPGAPDGGMPAAEEPVGGPEDAVVREPVQPEVADSTAAESVGPSPGDIFRDRLKTSGEGPEMVIVPAGTFSMGARSGTLAADERPRHTVSVDSFAVGRYEVGQEEYDLFARATGRRTLKSKGQNRKTHPAAGVSWDDAYAYVRWLSGQTGKQYRLLNEAEWEYVARAGTDTPFWWGFKTGQENAHCFDCESGLHPRRTAKRGFFEPNPFGLYDTAGNVGEWVHDCYHPNYKGAPDRAVVWEGGDCTLRVVRGGSYSSASSALRGASRDKRPSNKGFDDIGIRVARDL